MLTGDVKAKLVSVLTPLVQAHQVRSRRSTALWAGMAWPSARDRRLGVRTASYEVECVQENRTRVTDEIVKEFMTPRKLS